jgi:hypothetical protein
VACPARAAFAIRCKSSAAETVRSSPLGSSTRTPATQSALPYKKTGPTRSPRWREPGQPSGSVPWSHTRTALAVGSVSGSLRQRNRRRGHDFVRPVMWNDPTTDTHRRRTSERPGSWRLLASSAPQPDWTAASRGRGLPGASRKGSYPPLVHYGGSRLPPASMQTEVALLNWPSSGPQPPLACEQHTAARLSKSEWLRTGLAVA